MPTVQCSCPSCKTLLQIAQALPVQVRCPRCSMTFMVGVPPQPDPRQATTAAPHIPITLGPGKGVARLTGHSGTAVASRRAPVSPTRPRGSVAPQGNRKGLLFLLGIGSGILLVALVLILVLILSKSKDPNAEEDGSLKIADASGFKLTPQQRKVNSAIDRGVAYLKQRLQDGSRLYAVGSSQGGGAHPGAVALAGLTLLECGTRAEDPALQEALRAVRGQARQLTFTYTIAAAILFLDRFNNPKERPIDANDRELIKNMALRLIAGQNANGGWAYYCAPLDPGREQNLVAQLQQNTFRPGTFFVPGQRPGRDDNSIGQFATLALWAARKHGVSVRTSLKAVEVRYRPRQSADGSWQYHDLNRFARDTSTCAALIGLAVARGVEDDGQPGQGKKSAGDITKDLAVQKGLRYLGAVVGKKPALSAEEQSRRRQHTARMEQVLGQLESGQGNRLALLQEMRNLDRATELRGILFDGDNWGDLYFLWSLERMAVIYDLKKIQDKDWYEWGSEIILANQQADGSWSERFPGVPDTCFALLFLRRANIVKDLTDKLREQRLDGAGARPGPGVPPQPGRKD